MVIKTSLEIVFYYSFIKKLQVYLKAKNDHLKTSEQLILSVILTRVCNKQQTVNKLLIRRYI